MFRLFKKSKNQKISESRKAYYKEHGDTRRVEVKSGDRVVQYIYLAKKPAGVSFIDK